MTKRTFWNRYSRGHGSRLSTRSTCIKRAIRSSSKQWEIWFGLITKKELPELLNYAFNSAKDFQHKLRNRALDFDIEHFKKRFDTLIDMT